jgi:hypothetical protein
VLTSESDTRTFGSASGEPSFALSEKPA